MDGDLLLLVLDNFSEGSLFPLLLPWGDVRYILLLCPVPRTSGPPSEDGHVVAPVPNSVARSQWTKPCPESLDTFFGLFVRNLVSYALMATGIC